MHKTVSVALLSICALASFACSSSSGGAANDGGTGFPGGSGLSGTWDLVATGPSGTPVNGTLVISSTQLTITIGTGVLSFSAPQGGSPTATFQESQNAVTTPIAVTHQEGAIDTGSLPLDVGGSWTFAAGGQCTMTSLDGTFNASCVNPSFPSGFPRPVNGTVYQAVRQSTAASEFGSLGGSWNATDGAGGAGNCAVTFQGSTFTSLCNSGVNGLAGTAQLTFVNDQTASGTTSGGVELSARKR